MTPDAVLDFWFSTRAQPLWFARNAEFDAQVRARLGAAFALACEGRLEGWAETPRGLLALVVLLDQVPRNLHRGGAQAFATDARALALAEAGLARGFDATLAPAERQFLYMPFMHAEDSAAQARSVALFEALAYEDAADYARQHRDVIRRFGRFPGRNAALGRPSTPAEEAFLAEENKS